MGRDHLNSILDSRMYQVEFAGSGVTELTANIIACMPVVMQTGMSIYSLMC